MRILTYVRVKFKRPVQQNDADTEMETHSVPHQDDTKTHCVHYLGDAETDSVPCQADAYTDRFPHQDDANK